VEAVQVRSDRWYDLPASRASVWEAFGTTDRFRTWWPWLLEFEGDRLDIGQRWSCAVSPPLPYVVRFTLDLVVVEHHRMIRAEVRGDVVGDARLDLVDDEGGCRLHLVSDLAPGNAALQLVAVAARPIVRRGHDWVLDTGARQFVERAL
jgi:uncharacterized protein YndB with AHSA1/START domain